jgi:CBS domain containing-hemolysin-like protein
LISIGFSFLCSILEAVLLSVTPAYINDELRKGTNTGKLLEQYKEDIDRPLSAILTLNTIAHTLGAIGVGAMAGDVFGENMVNVLGLEISIESIVAVVMTLAILILSEIIPKTIGANNWKALSPFTVNTIRFLLFILMPLVWISQLITRGLKKEKEKSVLSRSDIFRLAEEAESSGTLKETESTIIKNLLEFEKKSIRDIMTPRSVAFMIEKGVTVKDFVDLSDSETYSRIPLFDGDKDKVIGFILKKDILRASSEDRHDESVLNFKRNIDRVRDNSTLPSLFKAMGASGKHIFMVDDEFGNVLGLVTMEDLFEELLGYEIIDESDRVADLQELARERATKKK